MAIGKSFNLKKQKDDERIDKDFWAHAEARKEFHLSSSYWTENFSLSERDQNHSLSHKSYIIERNSSVKKYTMRVEDWRKAKTSEAKTNSIIIDIWVKDGILYLMTTLRKNSFRWKALRKALHLILFEGESKHMLPRLAAQRTLWDKNSSSKPKNPGSKRYSQVWTLGVVLISELRESRVTHGSEDSGDLSLRDAYTEEHKQKTFQPKQCWYQMQRRQWKRNERSS